LLIGQDATRVKDLVPVRHGRMLVSAFTFFRGAALPMAADLSTGPSSGLWAQLCGDAHLSNFGAFGSPERRLIFDVNDFDETLPGPFEWDVKRLIASLAVAGRSNGFTAKQRRKVLMETGSAYRKAMREFATMPMIAVWYARFDVEQTLAAIKSKLSRKSLRSAKTEIAKAHTQDNTRALAKLTTSVDGQSRIVSNPPLIVPIEELSGTLDVDQVYASLQAIVATYALSLPPDLRSLLQRYRLTRVARKVVGVGSVGTESWVVLMEPLDGLEPLLLQAKQASASVLASYLRPSEYDNQGERVVAGQRLMQAASDIFLGWERTDVPGLVPQDYYVRQLRDWKYSVPIDSLNPSGLSIYGQVCGWTLARAHARTGDRIAMASYLGATKAFEQTLADFAETYADVTESDHAAMAQAAGRGRIEAAAGI
jgi:uncharacterized protein (DUF2252 family)